MSHFHDKQNKYRVQTEKNRIEGTSQLSSTIYKFMMQHTTYIFAM